jgi:hypothetical protein
MASPIDRRSQPWEPADEFVVSKQEKEEGHNDNCKDRLKPRMITCDDWAGQTIPQDRSTCEMIQPKYNAIYFPITSMKMTWTLAPQAQIPEGAGAFRPLNAASQEKRL